jgi:DNA-binding MarR family transcriptional regulator
MTADRPARLPAERNALICGESGADHATLSAMSTAPGFTPKVLEILAAVVASGGEAMGADLVHSCGLSQPQLRRQLNWMEKQDLVNQVHNHDGRTWVRATQAGRYALEAAAEDS